MGERWSRIRTRYWSRVLASAFESYTFKGYEAFSAATLVYVLISFVITALVNLYNKKCLALVKGH